MYCLLHDVTNFANYDEVDSVGFTSMSVSGIVLVYQRISLVANSFSGAFGFLYDDDWNSGSAVEMYLRNP
jgi:hypothetical protein